MNTTHTPHSHNERGESTFPVDHNPENPIEPRVDPDSKERLAEERPEAPHHATRFDAGTGQGTVSGPPKHQELQERPVLDGSTQDRRAESTVPNPTRGQADPAMVQKQPALNNSSSDRWMLSAVIAVVVLIIALGFVTPWNPVACIIGMGIAILGLIGMVFVRMSSMSLKSRLRFDAVLLAIIWLVPLAIFFTVLFTSSGQIWSFAS